MHLTPTEMYHARAFIFLIAEFVTSMASLISIPLHWAKPSDFVSQLLKPDAWASEETANIIVSVLRIKVFGSFFFVFPPLVLLN